MEKPACSACAIHSGAHSSHDIQQAFTAGSQYNEVTRVNYNAGWAFHRYASLFGDMFYSRGEEPLGDIPNDYDQYGFGLGANYQITAKLPVSLTYRHTIRSSNQPGGDYDVNQVILSIHYWF